MRDPFIAARSWFKAHPHRSYYCRVATPDELVWAQAALEHNRLVAGCHLFML